MPQCHYGIRWGNYWLDCIKVSSRIWAPRTPRVGKVVVKVSLGQPMGEILLLQDLAH